MITITPADLPFPQRDRVVDRLSALLSVTREQIIEALDRNAGLRFDPVRIASDVPVDLARVVTEESRDLPGVAVSVENRRQYAYGPLVSHVIGYTGAVTAGGPRSRGQRGYLPTIRSAEPASKRRSSRSCRGTYGLEQLEHDASGRVVRSVQTIDQPQDGELARAHARHPTQQEARGRQLGDGHRGPAARRDHRHEPADRRDPGDGLATRPTTTTCSRAASRTTDYQALIKDPAGPLTNFALERAVPARFHVQARDRRGRAGGPADQGHDHARRPRRPRDRRRKYWDWNHKGWGPLDIYDGFGHSSDTFFYQLAGMLGIDRLATGRASSASASDRRRPARRGARHRARRNEWKQSVFDLPIYPARSTRPGIGQGYDAVTPLQLLNAYCALANGGTLYQPQIVHRILAPDGRMVRDFQPEVIHQLDVDPQVLEEMRLAARRVLTVRHTYNWSTCQIVVAGKSGTAEFGIRDSRAGCPSTRGSPPSCPSSGRARKAT